MTDRLNNLYRKELAKGFINPEKLTQFINEGADINESSERGSTALNIASACGDTAFVEFLLSRGADTSIANYHGLTAFLSSVQKGHIDIFNLLVNEQNIEQLDTENNWTPLFHAYANGRYDVFNKLIEQGANIHHIDNNGKPILLITQKYPSMIQILVDKGVDINAQDKLGWTALHSAIWSNKIKSVELLFKLGADVGMKTTTGDTAMSLAAHKSNIRIIKLLVASGADVNNVDIHGDTPLMDAVSFDEDRDNKSQYIEVIEFLLNEGANPGFINSRGVSILETSLITEEAKILIKNKINEIESLCSKERGDDILRTLRLNR